MSPERLVRSNKRARRTIAGMLVAALRHHTDKTQAQLAELVGVKQPVIARMEMQDDLRLSTLHAIVNALGGSLRITLNFRVEKSSCRRQSMNRPAEVRQPAQAPPGRYCDP